ncbi:Plasmodium exported protein, unknown function [Plasmodium malariae]|uniref:Fam-m protein n=1 Tax=Plasmodium malariae TaxID=5858 RepID=A0A1D3JMW7_PLAMA|nr:Plasmodium exported protein, unknown function [Plasmodium malariae]SBT88030.1 Plasmodium exported protein, unknown function [Plasmodium malariae]
MLFFFFKILMFTFLVWICLIIHDVSVFNKSVYENYKFDRKLYEKSCRLLAKNKQKKCTYIKWIKEEIPNKIECKKKNLYNNKKEAINKNKQSKEYSLKNAGFHEQYRIDKNVVRTGGNLCFKKSNFDKIYYKNKVRDTANADFKYLRKCMKKKVLDICTLSGFYILLGILLLVLGKCKYIRNIIVLKKLNLLTVLLVIFMFVVILSMFYFYRKFQKYEKLTCVKSDIYNTAYPSLR